MTKAIEQAIKVVNKVTPPQFTPAKKQMTEDMIFVIDTSPYLTDEEKTEFKKLLTIYDIREMEALKKMIQSLSARPTRKNLK